jgi:hypothetical protein
MSEDNKNLKHLTTFVAKLQESTRQIHNHFSPIIEQQKKLQENIHPILDIQKQIQKLFSPALELSQNIFIELPLKTQEALIELGKNGWFLDLEMTPSELWELNEALITGDVKKAENTLIEHFKGRLSEIEKSVIDDFPHRKKIIMAAFRAHERREYELSIPVLLAQTDGICYDTTNEYLFLKQNKKPKTAIYVEQHVSNKLRLALLQPLMQVLPIGASESERDDDFNELNRNMVLHGESLDYGTEVNSLKAISLINYVSWALTS